MSPSTSTIRVYVHWSEPTVFAGEEVACQIVFKNIAALPGTPQIISNPKPATGGISASSSHRKPVNPAQIAEARGRQSNGTIPGTVAQGHGHRTTLSLNVPIRIPGPDATTNNNNPSETAVKGQGHSHRRSVSIISLGTSEAGGGTSINGSVGNESPRVPFKKHGRSTSLQIVPRRGGHPATSGPPSASISHRSTTQPSPLFQNHSSTDIPSTRAFFTSPIIRDSHSDSSAVGECITTPDIRNDRRKGRSSPSHLGFRFPNTSFKFPASPPGHTGHLSPQEHSSNETFQSNGSSGHSPPTDLLSRAQHDLSNSKSAANLPTRILSPVSNTETPRSSGEFYSVSNHSNETLASEYIAPRAGLLPLRPAHTRRSSNLSMVSQYRPSSETLMMGYAQLQGTFILDGSLIDQEPFEVVKRKGVTGGQGGGVIGVEKNKRESGLLRGFGWGNITESLGGFLGGGELSSIKEMRTVANSRSIPLLSTPQSILFVDLKLAPGESKAFEYSFKLPRGLPPSHRGKAIKISYQLVLGTQRPGGTKEHQIKSVEVPFRVLGSVNEHGELLGHDLMSPYIILRDQASVKAVPAQTPSRSITKKKLSTLVDKKIDSTLEDFQSYVDDLLVTPNQSSSQALLTPGAPQRRNSSIPDPTSAKEAIDMAIMRSNLATDMQQSANRFEIARGGQRVSVIMLARPAYRLGETITAVIEFANAEIACYAVHISLESSEKVDQSLALRSDASINRVTRKVHASHSESALFARRIVFSPSIPMNSTPSFLTSGVSLDWKIVIEFVTPRADRSAERNTVHDTELLEEVSRDNRGIHLAAAEVLNCESFEIAVPLRVYGAVAGSSDKDETAEGLKI